MIARVLINRNIDSLNRKFSYIIPEEMNAFVGARVVVPFGRGNSKIIGIIVEICDEDDSDIELKPILEILDEEPLINQKDIDTASFISGKTFSNKIESLKLFLPPMDLNSIQKDLYSTRTLELVDESNLSHEEIREKLDSGEFKYSYSLKNQPSMYTKKILYTKKEADNLSDKQMAVYNMVKSGDYSRTDVMKRLSISDSPIISFREYKSPSGFRVLAGRNNIQNDQLTFKVSHKEDLWFHLRNEPGTHVILECHNKDYSEDDIIYVANVAGV